jgi:hypothetical protein
MEEQITYSQRFALLTEDQYTGLNQNISDAFGFKDGEATARTATLNFQLISGVIGTNIAFANGAVSYMGIPLNIRCKASTAITVATTGTFTGCTYNVEAFFKKIG